MRIVSKYYSSNVFVLERGNQVLIVDSAVEPEEIKKYVQGKQVVGVLLTHGHFDHALFADEYAKLFETKVYASRFAKEYLADHKKNYSTDFQGLFMEVKDFSNFVFLDDKGELQLGDFTVEYKQLGGHSKGDMCFKIGAELFVGDVLIGRDMGRIDLYGGNKEDMKKSLTYLIEEDYEIMHSGHDVDNNKSTQDKVASLWLKFLNR